MNKQLTIIGTITKDKLYFKDSTVNIFGGAPWFASELSKKFQIPLQIATTIGEDFSLKDLSSHVLPSSVINKVKGRNTSIEIYMTKKELPAIVTNFSGKIKNTDKLNAGSVLIVSTLFNEVDLPSLKKLRKKFNTIILDIQGYTRPTYHKGILLSDKIKKQPENLTDICQAIDIMKLNESEFKVLFPNRSLKQKMINLHNLGIQSIILTKGKKGCALSTGKQIIQFKSNKSGVKNFLGAGDKFLILIGKFLLEGNLITKSLPKAQRELEKLID